MPTSCSARRRHLKHALGLGEPEDELVLIYAPTTGELWGWGHTEETARASALQRMQALDAALARWEDEEPPTTYLRRCASLRVRVARSQGLELLWLLGM